MEHHFNTRVAEKYGIEEAILLHHFYYWIAKNAANDNHLHEGLYWTYNSKKSYASFFTYMNETKIFRVIRHLEQESIIVKGNYNEDKWDKTNWYAITKQGLDFLQQCGYDMRPFFPSLQNDTIDSGKMNDGARQNDTIIFNYNNYTCNNNPCNNNKEKKEEKKEDKSSLKEKENLFVERMYSLYPTKCPVRGVSLGKTSKDKVRLHSLLKKYSMEDIERVITLEVKNKYGKYRLRNFSTFLNNFPDPSQICENTTPQQGNLFNNLPVGMIITESSEERNKKLENEKGW